MDFLLEYSDTILTALGLVVPFLGVLGVAVKSLKKVIFYVKVVKQAVVTFEEVKDVNKKIYERVQNDPERKELAKVLSGAVNKIEGLTNLDLDIDGKG